MTDVAPVSLIIDTRQLDRLSLDGPALKVIMRARSPVLFPLRRLCRIHLIGCPDGGMDALLHCAEQNIPVAFFRFNGRLRCRLLPPVGESTLVDHWFEHVEFDPEVRQIYREWRSCQALHVLALLGCKRGDCNRRQQLVTETLRGYCRGLLGKVDFAEALEWLDGLMNFHLAQVIDQFGFVQPRGSQRLLGDLAGICHLWLLHAFASSLRKGKQVTISPKQMTGFYQQHAQELDYLARRMLTQLVTRLEAIS